MPWRNALSVGRAYELLRADLLEHVDYLQREIGYRYCRFHGLFHDDMDVVRTTSSGALAYQWHHVDKVYDALLARGLRPFVELNPMPSALASGEQTIFHWRMNVTPPKRIEAWEDLVRSFARHLVERYGLDEVRKFYFEVWNEPNLPGFWSGTQDGYFELYRASARALRSVDTALRVGGPASSKVSWLEDMVQYAASTKTPLDFLSTHLYPQDEYVDYPDRQGSPYPPGRFFVETIREARRRLNAVGCSELPLHFTEWNAMSAASSASVSWVENPTNDSLYGASFVTQACLELDDVVDTLSFWVASDLFEEGGMPHSPYSCTYGLLTIHGIPKASCNAFRLLARLRGETLRMDASSLPDAAGAMAVREGDRVSVLLHNHKPLETSTKPRLRETLRVETPASGEHVAVISSIGDGQGSAWSTWNDLGRPHHLTPELERLLRCRAEPGMRAALLAPRDGVLELPVDLGDNEVWLVEVRPRGDVAMGKGASAADTELWDRLMGERSR
jgi:xylan 1,4-beta-xylosidase